MGEGMVFVRGDRERQRKRERARNEQHYAYMLLQIS